MKASCLFLLAALCATPALATDGPRPVAPIDPGRFGGSRVRSVVMGIAALTATASLGAGKRLGQYFVTERE